MARQAGEAAAQTAQAARACPPPGRHSADARDSGLGPEGRCAQASATEPGAFSSGWQAPEGLPLVGSLCTLPLGVSA